MPASRAAEAGVAARSLRDHARAVSTCTACGLHAGRIKPVVGEGPPNARLVIVGGAPRRHEDLHGVPFAGSSRNVLEHALSRAGLAVDEVRFTTVVRCRPRDDRAPSFEEVATCTRHLASELEVVAPEVIVTLGAFATSVILGRPVVLERVAGYRLDALGATLIPTHHPADAARGNPQAADAIRRDLAVAKAVMDGRMKSGAQALAELRSRLVADE